MRSMDGTWFWLLSVVVIVFPRRAPDLNNPSSLSVAYCVRGQPPCLQATLEDDSQFLDRNNLEGSHRKARHFDRSVA